MRQPRRPHISSSGYQSEQLRASRVTSIDRINPISLRPTRPTSSLKPFLLIAEAPLMPRSASITSISASCQPSSWARSRGENCSRRLSWLLMTWCGVDWRDVNNRSACQMSGLDQFGLHDTPPPELRRPRREFDVATRVITSPTGSSDLPSCPSRVSANAIRSRTASTLSLI